MGTWIIRLNCRRRRCRYVVSLERLLLNLFLRRFQIIGFSSSPDTKEISSTNEASLKAHSNAIIIIIRQDKQNWDRFPRDKNMSSKLNRKFAFPSFPALHCLPEKVISTGEWRASSPPVRPLGQSVMGIHNRIEWWLMLVSGGGGGVRVDLWQAIPCNH